jgi:hypothetical protein
MEMIRAKEEKKKLKQTEKEAAKAKLSLVQA